MADFPNINEDLTRASNPLKITQRWYDILRAALIGTAVDTGNGGALILGAKVITSLSYTVGAKDFALYFNPLSIGVTNVALPAATGSGRVLAFKRIATGIGLTLAISINPSGTDQVDSGGAGVGFNLAFSRAVYMIQDVSAGNWYFLDLSLTLTG